MITPTVKATDTFPIEFTANADLTGIDSSRLLARRGNLGELIELAHVVTDAEAGIVTHVLDGTLEPGLYRLELEVIRGAEKVTFPTRQKGEPQFVLLRVISDLDTN